MRLAGKLDQPDVAAVQRIDIGQVFLQRCGIAVAFIALVPLVMIAENQGDNLEKPVDEPVGPDRVDKPVELAVQHGKFADHRAGHTKAPGKVQFIQHPPGADLSVDAPVALMSGGQRPAIAVARATVFARNLVMLDDPTAALGPRESRKVLDLIAQLRARGNAMFLIAHTMEHVGEPANHAVVLWQGRKVGELTPSPTNKKDLVAMIVGAEG